MSNLPTRARVKQIATKRLFGLYDHKVPLHLDDRVTIIHGANGVGKTILLRLVHALFSQDYAFLMSVPYEEVEITLDDGTQLTIQNIGHFKPPRPRDLLLDPRDLAEIKERRGIAITVTAPSSERSFVEVHADQFSYERWASRFEASTPWIREIAPEIYYDSRSEATYSAAELWKAYSELSEGSTPLTIEIPAGIQTAIAKVRTYLVEAQRLVRFGTRLSRNPRRPEVGPTPTVLTDAQELAAKLKDAFSQYGRESQKLDQSFPQRLFSWQPTMATQQIQALLKEVQEDQEKLSALGVLDTAQSNPFSPALLAGTNTAKLDLMELFVRDSKEKLKPLLEFASRVEPLLSSINSKFKNKSVRLDRERGLLAKGLDGGEIRPDQLSSGEQHEIVLLFHLLFRVSKDTLVLIDEPELSLHIDWQRQFLPELLNIAGGAQIDALVATHSPSIVGERDDLMIDLGSVPSHA
jgi:predicted ATPase